MRSKLHIAILGYYMRNPDANEYLRALSRRLSFSVAHLSRELDRLSKEGLFLAKQAGKEKYFRINPKYKFFHELRRIVLKQ